MFTRVLLSFVVAALLPAQQSPPPSAGASANPAESAAEEFPVVMQQNIVAGKTPPGTQIQAKLEVATLVNGKVVPRNAVLSGEVLVSSAKTSSDPSRLSVRMNSISWKGGSAPIKVYLTSWFYPALAESGQDLQYGPQQPANRTWNGEGQYPDPNSRVYRPFPGADSSKNSGVPDTPTSVTSSRRAQMKNVESTAEADGTISLASHHNNIKIDRLTTYVLSGAELMPASKSK